VLMRQCRSRTSTIFGELLSQLLKIGRSAVDPAPDHHPLTTINGLRHDLLSVYVQLIVQILLCLGHVMAPEAGSAGRARPRSATPEKPASPRALPTPEALRS